MRVRNRRHLLGHGGAGGGGGGGGGNPQQGGDTGAISTVGIAGSMANGDNNRFYGKQIFLGAGAHTSTVVASPTTIASDGSASSTIIVTVLDNFFSGPIQGSTVTLAVAASDAANVTITQPATTTNAAGVTTGSLTTTVNGDHIVTATADGIIIDQTATVTGQTSSAPDSTSTLALSASSEAVGANVVATVQAKHTNSNVTTGGATVVITNTGGTSVITIGTVTDNGDGTYTANIGGVTAGTATTISATINSIACTNTPALTVTGGGGTTGNIYTWGFEGATDAIASGAYTDSGVHNGFIPTTAWSRDSTQHYAGSQSVSQIYTPGGAGINRGDAFFYTLSPTRSSLYVRFAYMQSNPFNDTGGNSNYDGVKMLRFFQTSLDGPYGGIGINNVGKSGGTPQYIMGTDDMSGPDGGSKLFFANTNLPAPLPNNKLGQWQVFTTFFDWSTNNAIIGKCWIDGVLYFNYTFNCSNLVPSPHPNAGNPILAKYVQFDGTINSVINTCTAWIDTSDIGTNDLSGLP